jgi:4-hydroxythreonine-4-phosphate dehydrogenase
MYCLSITCGDVNGIGPEISIKTINKIFKPGREQIVFFCPADVFESTSSIVKPAFDFQIIKELKQENTFRGKVIVVDIGKVKPKIGEPSAKSGAAAFKAILSAFDSVKNNFSDAIITAPLSKTSLQMAGINYPGQTEIMADLCNSKNYMMVFLSPKMVCGLLTIHESIKNVPKLITSRRLKNAVGILEKTLIRDLGIISPKIAVLGLNPHAGEKGKIGTEELKIIEPFIDSLAKDKSVYGPFVPDAFFATKTFYNYDAVLGMYHDQLLIPFKMMNFNRGVNYTAGLQVIRTSPDHGTAFDIAGKGVADESSMVEAVKWAKKIIRNRKKNAD